MTSITSKPSTEPVVSLASNPREQRLLALSQKGQLGIYFITNERTLLQAARPAEDRGSS